MVPLAPRYDPRIVDSVWTLDDRGVPIAEVCRRVGATAECLGLIRPSYSHLRRLVHRKRDREDEIREAREAVRRQLERLYFSGIRVDVDELADDLARARR